MSYGDLKALIGEDQGRIGRSELGVRHCELNFPVRGRFERKRLDVSSTWRSEVELEMLARKRW